VQEAQVGHRSPQKAMPYHFEEDAQALATGKLVGEIAPIGPLMAGRRSVAVQLRRKAIGLCDENSHPSSDKLFQKKVKDKWQVIVVLVTLNRATKGDTPAFVRTNQDQYLRAGDFD
jgi:hypothetical protein